MKIMSEAQKKMYKLCPEIKDETYKKKCLDLFD